MGEDMLKRLGAFSAYAWSIQPFVSGANVSLACRIYTSLTYFNHEAIYASNLFLLAVSLGQTQQMSFGKQELQQRFKPFILSTSI